MSCLSLTPRLHCCTPSLLFTMKSRCAMQPKGKFQSHPDLKNLFQFVKNINISLTNQLGVIHFLYSLTPFNGYRASSNLSGQFTQKQIELLTSILVVACVSRHWNGICFFMTGTIYESAKCLRSKTDGTS